MAVVNKDFCDNGASFAKLKGERSCHTGYARTAGWVMPVGFMLNSGLIQPVRKNSELAWGGRVTVDGGLALGPIRPGPDQSAQPPCCCSWHLLLLPCPG